MTGLVLDGGRASRFGGRHKAFLVVEGRPIAERTSALFRRLFAELLVATDRPAPWARLAPRIVSDPIRGAGPVAGIAAGLEAARTPLVFVAAGDMPFLSADVVRELVRRARHAPGAAIVPRRDGRAEPLHAVYPADLASVAHRALLEGRRKLTDFLSCAPVRWVDFEELAAVPGAQRTFANVNSPADLPREASGSGSASS